jgi:hypothetical protein
MDFFSSKYNENYLDKVLYEKDYSKIVREKIIDLKKQYAALIYNRDKNQEIDDNELQLTKLILKPSLSTLGYLHANSYSNLTLDIIQD